VVQQGAEARLQVQQEAQQVVAQLSGVQLLARRVRAASTQLEVRALIARRAQARSEPQIPFNQSLRIPVALSPRAELTQVRPVRTPLPGPCRVVDFPQQRKVPSL